MPYIIYNTVDQTYFKGAGCYTKDISLARIYKTKSGTITHMTLHRKTEEYKKFMVEFLKTHPVSPWDTHSVEERNKWWDDYELHPDKYEPYTRDDHVVLEVLVTISIVN